MPNRLLMVVVVLIFLTGFFYWWGLRPTYADIRKEARQVQVLEQSTANLQAQLRSKPPIGAEEQRLWLMIEEQLDARLNSEEDITATLTTLADLAQKSGAALATVTVKAPETPKAAPVPSYVRGPRRVSTRNDDMSLEPIADRQSARQTGGATEGQAANQSTLQPGNQPPLARAPRYAPEPAPEPPGFAYGQRRAVYHPAYLKIKGDYATWPVFLTRVSQSVLPVLIEKIEGYGGGTAGHLDILLSVPVVDKRAIDTAVQARDLPPIAVDKETARLYHLDVLAGTLPEYVRPVETDPFPDVLAEVVMEEDSFVFPELTITAILERSGEFVAVINERIVAVGDMIEGVEVKSITPTTVVFAEKLR